MTWRKARGSVNDDVHVFRYDREGRVIEERDGAFRQHVRHVVRPASAGDPIGLPYPDTWPERAIAAEALTESRWDEARHLEVVLDGTLLYERVVGRGEVIATAYGTAPGGVELVRAHHFAWGFYETPLRRVDTRSIPALSGASSAVVERWEALGEGELVLTRRTLRLETGCLE